MSIFSDARACVLVADYAAIDGGGKINALGACLQFLPTGPDGLSAPHAVVAVIELPVKHAGQQFATSLELRDETTGEAAKFLGQSGQPEAMRISQLVVVEKPQIPGVYLPDDVYCRAQIQVQFANGIPIVQGHRYAWRLEIEGQHQKSWLTHFYVPGPPPAPVIGGPSTQPTGMPDLPV